MNMPIKCQAAITTGNGDVFIDEIEVYDPQEDEVLVQIKAAGICHTDQDSLNWGKKLVLGHEGAGIVIKKGKKVTGVIEGDHVILNWAIPCGHCFQCLEGNLHICENNSPVTAGNKISGGHAHLNATTYRGKPVERSFSIGTLSQYTVVKEAAVVKNNSEQLSFPAASIIGCGVMTGYGSVMNAANVRNGSSVVVLGAGGVGLNVIQASVVAKANKIIAIDINGRRLEMAKQFGATHLVLADKNDSGLLEASQTVKQMTNGRGADYAFECTAIPELGAAPLAMIRNAGMAIQVSGIEQEITIDMNLFEWDKIYLNPLYGKCNPQRDFKKIIDHYEKGELMLDAMITRTYSLMEIQNALEDMLSGRNAKGVIVFD